jgi:tRNA A37 methylthiotransferase MiaB
MVGDTHEVLAVEPGTGDSVKCRDGAYRQVIITNASERGVEVGDFLEVEITAHEAMYCFGEPIKKRQATTSA